MSDRADRFTAILDTNVLFGALTRNTLLTLAEAGFYRARWSDVTLDEFERVLPRANPQVSPEVAHRQREQMTTAFAEGTVTVDTRLLAAVELPDAHARHVLAAAIMARAGVIVSNNIKDFPKDTLSRYGITCLTADDFCADCIDLGGAEAVAAIRTMRQRFEKPEIDGQDLIRRYERCGMGQTANLLQDYLPLL